MNIKRVYVDFLPGTDIKEAIKSMAAFARANSCIVQTRFNSVLLVADLLSYENDLLRWYNNAIITGNE